MLSLYKNISAMLSSQQALLGRDHPSMASSRQSQINHLKMHIQCTKIDASEAAAMFAALAENDGPFTEAERKSIGEAVSAAATNPNDSPTKTTDKTAQQKHFYVHNYLTEGAWTTQFDKQLSLDVKLHSLAQFVQTVVGLVNPCEKTASNMTAISMLASDAQLSPVQAKAATEKLKRHMKTLRDNNRPIATLTVFPEEVEQFVSLYPGRYQEHAPPVESRVDVNSLIDMRRPDVMPCRKSAGSLRNPPAGAASSTPTFGGTSFSPEQMMMMMMQFMGGNTQPAQSSGDIPLRMFFNPQQQQQQQQQPQLTSDAALEAHKMKAICDKPARQNESETLPGGNVAPLQRASTTVEKMREKVQTTLKKKAAKTANKKTTAAQDEAEADDEVAEDADLEEEEEETEEEKLPKKRPAASMLAKPAAHVMKRPAASGSSSIEDAFPHLFTRADALKAKSKGAFTSKAYDTVKRLRNNVDDAKLAYHAAKRVYENAHGQ